MIVTLVADNEFGAAGAEHIASALRSLTGLQTLNLGCMCFSAGVCFCCVFYLSWLREGVMFEVWGAIERMGVVWAVIVTRVAVNKFGATGGKHIASALRLLTGLQTLHLMGTRFSLLYLSLFLL
jgi:hypothetical protein